MPDQYFMEATKQLPPCLLVKCLGALEIGRNLQFLQGALNQLTE